MSILVFGSNGLVGSNVVDEGRAQGYSVVGTYHSSEPDFDIELSECDIRDESRVRSVIRDLEPDVVVNCAAYTDVDGCEREPQKAQAVNAAAPGVMAETCAEHGVSFVHLSTDYVFDGTAERPYREDDEPNPIQVYGETKLEGERRVLDEHPEALVLRLSFVWGEHGATGDLQGFPAWVLDRARNGEALPLFTDQYVTPTNARFAAETVLSLVEREVSGIYNVASRDCVSPYEFGRRVLRRLTSDADLLEQRSMADVSRDAARPHDTCLETTILEEKMGRRTPSLDAEIEDVIPSTP